MSELSQMTRQTVVTLAAPRGMITLRGDLSDSALQGVCTTVTGCAFPDRTGIVTRGDAALAWMSPDEVLLLLPYDAVRNALAQIDAALAGRHHLAVDVSDARALLHVAGPGAREALAKLTPADLHPDSLGPGTMRRTRLGQVAAAFWMDADDRFTVICFRSVADYVQALLEASVEAGEVGYF